MPANSVTGAALQTALGTNAMNAIVQAELPPYGAAVQRWSVRGMVNAAGRTRLVTTTASDNAATQAAAVLTALRA
jgi:hypothetical protein